MAFAQNKELVLEKRVLHHQAEVEACKTEQSTENVRTDSEPYQSGMSRLYERPFLAGVVVINYTS